MKFLTLCITALWSLGLAADEPTIPRFYVDYAIVQHSLKNDSGAFDTFMKLAKLNPTRSDFIAAFWWGKAKRECMTTFNEIADRYAKKQTASTTLDEKAKLNKEVKAEADQCVFGVLYDHWDEINQMVEKQYQQLSADAK